MNPERIETALPTEPSLVAILAGVFAGLTAVMVAVGCLPLGLLAILVLAVAFLLAIVSVVLGITARHQIRRGDRLGGDLAAYVAVVWGSTVISFYLLLIGPHFVHPAIVMVLFWLLAGLIALYALATAVPAVRVALATCAFIMIPLSLSIIKLQQARDEARRTKAMQHLNELQSSFWEWQETRPGAPADAWRQEQPPAAPAAPPQAD